VFTWTAVFGLLHFPIPYNTYY